MNGRNMGRFWAKVDVGHPLGCWDWTSSTDGAGYGRFGNGEHGTTLAHRIAYMALVGEIAADLTLDHLCRNRGCVNPDHLEAVTQGENVLRGFNPAALNARKVTCLRGHALPPDRLCRVCRGGHVRKLQEKGPDHLPASAHGTPSTYNNYRCRCEPCKQAANEARRLRRLRAKAGAA